MRQDVFGKAAHTLESSDGITVERQAGWCSCGAFGETLIGALIGASLKTCPALSTVVNWGGDHVVTHLHIVHAASNSGDDTGNFMPEKQWKWEAGFNGGDVLVRVAEAAGLDVEENFVFERICDVHVGNPERFVDFFEYGSFHSEPLSKSLKTCDISHIKM